MESPARGVGAAEHHDAFREFFQQIQICEDGGMDFVWISEHHFNPTRSFGSASMVVAGAVAARTERIKIGSAVVVLPTHNPLHVTEETSVLDHLSNGRFELGVGRSGGVGAYRGFNMDYSESQPRFAECLEVVKRALSKERFSYEGEFYKYNDVVMAPPADHATASQDQVGGQLVGDIRDGRSAGLAGILRRSPTQHGRAC